MAYRSFPISFYKLPDGKIEYESGFTQGVANTLQDAFKEFSRNDFVDDLFMYYDDVNDIKVGKFEPGYRKKKDKEYIGKLNVSLDINSMETTNTVKYLSKNKDKIPAYVKNINREKQREKVKKGFSRFFNKVKDLLKMNEMFSPYKTHEDLICEHCGDVIPVGTYYEEFRKKPYHLECIWDKLINNRNVNTYTEAEKYFHNLKQYIGDWPAYGMDTEESYIDDLQLVDSNNRILNRVPMEENFYSVSQKLKKLLETVNEDI